MDKILHKELYYKNKYRSDTMSSYHSDVNSGHSHRSSGFTLLEMIVVVGIFALVLVTTTELFISIFNTYRKVNGTRQINQDARYALEIISREARLAKSITINSQNDVPSNQITATNQNGTQIVFKCVDCTSSNGVITMQKGTDPIQNLTSAASNIIKFEIDGTEIAKETDFNNIEPFFKLTIEAEAKVADRAGAKPKITFRTLISKRNY